MQDRFISYFLIPRTYQYLLKEIYFIFFWLQTKFVQILEVYKD
jgi:hypothetical protein